jgi:hypothetical protein
VPADLVAEVERYVDGELADARKYDNREPLDDSGVWSLHRLIASAYQRGYDDGQRSADAEFRGRQQRAADRARSLAAEGDGRG